jgi:hypothetical protein
LTSFCAHRVNSRRQDRSLFGRNASAAAHRPFPGEAGVTGLPPHRETRFVSNEVVLHAPSNVSAQAVDAVARPFFAKLAHDARHKCASHSQHFRQLILRHLEFELAGAGSPG